MKTLWFRDTYIAFLIVSYKNPRVIPMLYSFYLIVYLICISYLILLFPFLCVVVFFVCRLYIGFFLLSLILCYFMFVFGDKDRDYIIIDIVIFRILCYPFLFCLFFFGIYDNIRDSFMEISFSYIISMMIFILFVYHWLYVIWIILDL